MTEFSAFIVGLLLGESRTIVQPQKKAKLNSNIALQDVVFCQSLRNVIDGLEEYVRTSHPSMEEFIKHVLPDENFEEPYTDAEKQILESNKKNTDAYVKWITSKFAKSGERWEDLGAVKMIWQDEAHTPDIDNLDLMFGDPLLSAPVKHNGRVYEYNTIAPLSGLAKGFFETVPAKVIMALCLKNTQDTVAAYGYQYDYKRFEYNRQADKFGKSAEWKKEQRAGEYLRLLRNSPAFCQSTWSATTTKLKERATKK